MRPIDFTSVCWWVLAVFWAMAAFKAKRTVQHGQSPLVRTVSMTLLVLGFILYYLPLGSVPVLGWRIVPPRSPLVIVGMALCAGGVLFAIWARIFLGGNWSGAVTLKEGHSLVQTGPYAFVRHPIYTGILAGMVGTTLVVGDVRALLPLLNIFGIWRKMKDEETVMRRAFPDEYPGYEKRVKKLVPWII